MGYAHFFLGLEIVRGKKGTHVNQRKYVLDILSDAWLIGSKSVDTPLPRGLKLIASKDKLLSEPNKYKRLIGRLLYLNFTRSDITYAVQQLSQFVGSPCQQQWDAAIHVLRYLKGCPSKGPYLPANNSLQPVVYCDAGWVACPDTRRSLTEFCISLGPTLVSWRTKKQSTVSRSSAEAEYRSMASAACEVQWLSYLLLDLHVRYKQPIDLWCDNKAALHITANPFFHERTKHIEIDCHVVRERYQRGLILLRYVSTHLQLADIFTKSLAKA